MKSKGLISTAFAALVAVESAAAQPEVIPSTPQTCELDISGSGEKNLPVVLSAISAQSQVLLEQVTLTQNIDPATINLSTSTCVLLDPSSTTICSTAENRHARSYPIGEKLELIGKDFLVDRVDFAVRRNDSGPSEFPCYSGPGGDFEIAVNLYRDLNGGVPSLPGDLQLLGSSSVTIPFETPPSHFAAIFPAPVRVPAGSCTVVEISAPSRILEEGGDGGILRLGSNGAGQTGSVYLYAPSCGINSYVSLDALGAPGNHMIQTVQGTAVDPQVDPGPFDLILKRVEFTQAIQKPDDSIPMVFGKPIFVRAYVEWTGTLPPGTVGWDAFLHFYDNTGRRMHTDGSIDGIRISPGPTPGKKPNPEVETETFNFAFFFPDAQSIADIGRFVVEVNPCTTPIRGHVGYKFVPETELSNNVKIFSKDDLHFVERCAPRIGYVPIIYDGSPPDNTLIGPGVADSMYWAVYPVPYKPSTYYRFRSVPLSLPALPSSFYTIINCNDSIPFAGEAAKLCRVLYIEDELYAALRASTSPPNVLVGCSRN